MSQLPETKDGITAQEALLGGFALIIIVVVTAIVWFWEFADNSLARIKYFLSKR